MRRKQDNQYSRARGGGREAHRRPGRLEIKPTYMVVGAAKAGTTTLCSLIGMHPQVFMTDPKEPRFFSWDRFYARGLRWYESLYDGAGDALMRGEGSQSYSIRGLFPRTARRIAEYAPELKVIYIVRHPLERMESAWLEMRSWDYGRLRGFIQNAKVGPSIVHPDFSEAMRRNAAAYEDSSNYWREINVYRELFPDDQILVLFLDDLKADYRTVLRQCWEFLGVDPRVTLEPPGRSNEAAEKALQGRAYWYMLHVPGLDWLYRLTCGRFPDVWSALNRSLVSVRGTGRPRWDPQLRRDVVRRLRPDIETFLQFCGRRRDFWTLDSSADLDGGRTVANDS
jgi:hypothetical protein